MHDTSLYPFPMTPSWRIPGCVPRKYLLTAHLLVPRLLLSFVCTSPEVPGPRPPLLVTGILDTLARSGRRPQEHVLRLLLTPHTAVTSGGLLSPHVTFPRCLSLSRQSAARFFSGPAAATARCFASHRTWPAVRPLACSDLHTNEAPRLPPLPPSWMSPVDREIVVGTVPGLFVLHWTRSPCAASSGE